MSDKIKPLFEPGELEAGGLSVAARAERWRLGQARRLLASATIPHGGRLVREVATEGGGYMHIPEDALPRELRRTFEEVDREGCELTDWRQRYADVTDLSVLFAAIDAAEKGTK